ncbi:MAG: hypothetical protein LBW77_00705 [Verrucomicrobiota bacterium]|jgi:hypothetical protein|nr:hypothetical protein [Verrucomicrobiota bacterium]
MPLSPVQLFNWAYDISFGTLWWCQEETVAQRFQGWVRRDDRKGHPTVSIRKFPLTTEADCIPMLAGSSNPSSRAVGIRGITKSEPTRVTHFGKIIAPGLFFRPDFSGKLREEKPRVLSPAEKRRVDAQEEKALHTFVENSIEARLFPETERGLS